ncbi:hypothetical protein [Desulfobulbus sp.]|uniref:hypothetical protein n=1 Tax=Desulfobulbus sp. TaxID=895 RepID=UPI00286EE69A|nr:hypothetical protein [Desulfobulbus sp.]
MRIDSILLAVLLAGVTLLTGCAAMQSRFASDVDSLAQTDAGAKKRYVLLPGGKGVEAGDLQFQEFAAYVEKVLAEKGFVKVATFPDAEVAIFLTYAIGDPQTYQYAYSIPTWGQTGVSSANTFGTISSYRGVPTYSGTTIYTPTYGITGSTTHIGTSTVYTRFLFLDAYDVQAYIKERKMTQVWTTSVVSTGQSDDLRLVIPYMVAAMKPYLGTNTGRKIKVEVPTDDPEVQMLRGGPLPPVK